MLSLISISLLAFTTQSRIGLVVPNNYESLGLVCPADSAFPCFANNGEFTQTNQFDLANRRFYEGYFGCKDAKVVITTSGLATVNAALTTQLLTDTYRKRRDPIDFILTYGIAGGMDDRLAVGDVVVASKWALYSLWLWQDSDDGPNDLLPLEIFGDYDREFGFWNTTEFGRVWFQPQELFLEPEVRTRTHFFYVDANALAIMKSIESEVEDELISCIPDSVPLSCLPETPQLYTSIGGADVVGLTADIFVDNEEWRRTLFEFYGAQSIDMETAAVAMVAATNEIPFLAFRSLSDLAGAEDEENAASAFLGIAVHNSITVLTKWIEAAYCQSDDEFNKYYDDSSDDSSSSDESFLGVVDWKDVDVNDGGNTVNYRIIIDVDRRTSINVLLIMITFFFFTCTGILQGFQMLVGYDKALS